MFTYEDDRFTTEPTKSKPPPKKLISNWPDLGELDKCIETRLEWLVDVRGRTVARTPDYSLAVKLAGKTGVIREYTHTEGKNRTINAQRREEKRLGLITRRD